MKRELVDPELPGPAFDLTLGAFRAALESLDKLRAEALFNAALTGRTPIEVVEHLVVPALAWIGQAWDEGDVALSQVYMAGRYCEDLVARVLPPSDPDRKHQPRSAIVTLNDHHLLGKRIVHAQMRASGFELFDYGRMDVAELVDRVRQDRIRVLLVSVLLLPSALGVRALRDALIREGLDLRLVVGGAPFFARPRSLARGGRRRHGPQRQRRRAHRRALDGGAAVNTAPMNSMQRTLTTLGHAEPDRVPLFLLLTMHGAKELGLSIRDYFSRAEHVVEGQMRLPAKYQGDCLMGFFHAALEAQAWGGEVVFIEDGPPTAGAPVLRRPESIDRLEPPRVADTPCLQPVLDTLRELKARVGSTVPIIGVVMSPFSLPVMQMGFDAYLDLMHEHPDRFERLMRLNEAFAIEWANAQLAAGATAICYFDPVSSTTIIPRAVYLRTGQAVAQRVLPQTKGPTATHLASGRGLGILADIADTGTAIVGVSALDDLAALKAAARGRVSLLGNLNGITMRHWTPDQAQAEVRRAIAQAGAGGGFILSDNHGEIPWQVPDEVLLAIGDAARRWGTYPLAKDLLAA
jgi:uroporphyrinogen decarboxylase